SSAASDVYKRQKKEGLQGAGVYLDFRNNDARLVIENIKQAASDGGHMVSKMKAVGFLYEGDKIIGVKARDLLTGETIEIHAKLVINTSGPWVDKVRNMNFTQPILPKMRPTKGVHLVVDAKRLPVPQPTYFDTAQNDGRMVFAIPRENKTYFGTTDTDYQGDYVDPKVTQEDVDYLLTVINHRYPEAKLTLQDIESSWAGLRPLLIGNAGSDYNGGDNGNISTQSFQQAVDVVTDYKDGKATRDEVEDVLNNLESSRAEKRLAPSSVSRGSSLEQAPDGMITLSGGKITDYRKMAAGAIELIRKLLQEDYDLTFKEVDSKTYAVSGGDFDPTKVAEMVVEQAKIGVAAGLSEEEAAYIADFYGTNASKIFQLAKEMDAYPGMTLAESARLRYGMEEEMVLTPVDYLLRRTNHLLFERDTVDALRQPVLDAIAAYFEWEEAEKAEVAAQLAAAIDESDLTQLKTGGNN
ncbi:FAD-dependent oxidoreductase, partial [uncultured Enterococcus sp.]|uniref:FAD-dependent oxidoreductase n=1 Tax=uncultured Enterococcus sp. TaxID=167972 RepID=UPI0025882F30